MDKAPIKHRDSGQKAGEDHSEQGGQMLAAPPFQLQASGGEVPGNNVGHGRNVAAPANAPLQRVTDYDALARRVKEELGEVFPDLEDLLAVFESLPPGGGLQSLMGAYNLINPKKPLVMHLQERLSEGDYLRVMDAASSVAVAKTTTSNPAVLANTQEAGYNLRARPSTSGAIIGKLRFAQMPVSVIGKGKSGDINWNKIRFKNAADYARVIDGYDTPDSAKGMVANQDAWVTGDALGTYVPWDVFMSQLHAFDIFTYDKSLSEKITLLRQMAHPEALPFDEVIGTDAGNFYEDDRNDSHALFQLMKEGKAIQTPNGEVIDIYHFIVGLDAYPEARQHEKASVTKYLLFGNGDVGISDAAATWSGDLGAAAADCLLESSGEVEKHLDSEAGKGKEAADSDRLDYYYRSRAPEADLLGDIDAWGAMQDVDVDSPALSVTEVINNYYGAQRRGKGAFQNNRKEAFTKFMARYGLTADGGTVINDANRAILTVQIQKFGVSWVQNREKSQWPSYDEARLLEYSRGMADRFLKFIDDRGKANGAF